MQISNFFFRPATGMPPIRYQRQLCLNRKKIKSLNSGFRHRAACEHLSEFYKNIENNLVLALRCRAVDLLPITFSKLQKARFAIESPVSV